MPRKVTIALSNDNLAQFFLGLSRLLQTGMPLDKILTNLRDDREPKLANAITETIKPIQRGKSLAEAGRVNGLWRMSDYRLIQAGENSGNLVSVTRNLAEMYLLRARRMKKFRSRMVLPVITLTIGLFLAPLPGIFNGNLDAWGYLAHSLIPLIIILLVVKFLINNTINSRAQGKPTILDLLLRLFPAGKRLIDDQASTEFLNNLGMYLQAGVEADKAIKWTIESSTPGYRARFRVVQSKLRSGSNVSDALLAAGVLGHGSDYPEISSGEAAGKLEESILHRVAWHQEDIDLRLDQIADWAPRLIYSVVAVWFVIGLFTSF
jgi:type II secretory pathway component PulF